MSLGLSLEACRSPGPLGPRPSPRKRLGRDLRLAFSIQKIKDQLGRNLLFALQRSGTLGRLSPSLAPLGRGGGGCPTERPHPDVTPMEPCLRVTDPPGRTHWVRPQDGDLSLDLGRLQLGHRWGDFARTKTKM